MDWVEKLWPSRKPICLVLELPIFIKGEIASRPGTKHAVAAAVVVVVVHLYKYRHLHFGQQSRS